MSERMTEARWEYLNAIETVWTKREQAEIAGEVADLQNDVMERDAMIKALADALERYGTQCRVLDRPSRDCGCVGCQSARALRLAGRL